MCCNGSATLEALLEDDLARDHVSADTIARAIAIDLVDMAGITPQDWPVGTPLANPFADPRFAGEAGSDDLIVGLLARRRQAISQIDDARYATEAEANLLMDQWGACDAAAIAHPAKTRADAAASIEWARDELLQFGLRPAEQNGGGRALVLALLDGALGVLRRDSGEADTSSNRQAA